MRFILPIFFWFTFAYILLASDSYSVERIQPSNQFPVSEVTDIHLGNKGLLWLGTNSGLFYYDGYSIKSQHSLLFDSKDLTNDYIHDILQDDIGNIFLLTAFGIEKYHVLSKISEPILRLSSVEQTKFISIYNHLNILIHSSNSITRYSFRKQRNRHFISKLGFTFFKPFIG
jgi:ligand-binding sensor domain-containing protein